MSRDETVQMLRGVIQFRRLSDHELRRLTAFTDEVCVPAGALLAEQGRLCHQLLIVASGVLETCRSGRSGRLGPGEVFGWDAMRTRGANDATVLAVSSTRLLVMSHQQFQAAAALV